jgi:hypothetical protein
MHSHLNSKERYLTQNNSVYYRQMLGNIESSQSDNLAIIGVWDDHDYGLVHSSTNTALYDFILSLLA